jgi:hypothetical protein
LAGERLDRFRAAGLDLGVSPTRVRAGGAVIAQNCFVPPNGALRRRPGYRRWLEVGLGAPVTLVTKIGSQVLLVAGLLVDEELDGDPSC